MAKEIKLPDIGEGVTEGELVQWLVQVGDAVEADQPIAEIMTDKATVEVPTPVAGTIKEFKAEAGDVIPIESTLLILEEGDVKAASESTSAKAGPTPSPSVESSPKPPSPGAPVSAPSSASMMMGAGGVEIYPPVAESRVLATPSTRRFAREINVDINNISGTGVAGRVTREDVIKAKSGGASMAVSSTQAKTSAPATSFKEIPKPGYQSVAGAEEERVPLRGIRRKIAEQMQMTKQVVPHFTIMDEANVTSLVKFREQAKQVGQEYGVKVTYLPFVIKALIAALREFPMLNASIDDEKEEIVYKKYFNIGFAADTPNGLLVPVIKNADQKTILQLSQEINDLAKKAREGKLALDEMKGATITITNIGSVGGTYATPIINHPEVAILGMYKMETKPVFKNNKFVAQKMMNFTATCDHRLIDGAVAANFLKAFMKRIENPSHLMMDMV